eukprot:6489752-Amphidinium_carterae.1
MSASSLLLALTLWTLAVIWFWTKFLAPGSSRSSCMPVWFCSYLGLLWADVIRLWISIRRRLRRYAMRTRPFVMSSEVDGEAVILSTSPFIQRTPSTARRSLADIQRDVQGGKLCPARRCKEKRFSMIKKKNIRVVFNPRIDGECLFDCLRAGLLWRHGKRVSTKTLRRWLKDGLQQADPERVLKCAAQFGMSHREYVDRTTKGRWGTSLDVEILAPLLNIPVFMIDCEKGRLLHEHVTGSSPLVLCYRDKHFTLGRATGAVKAAVRKKTLSKRAGYRKGGAGNQREEDQRPQQVRQYPFANLEGDTTGDRHETAQQRAAVDQAQQPTAAPRITIVFHGSFSPFHMGHYRTARSAIEFFAARNVIADTVLIGFTTPKQLRRKIGESIFLYSDHRVRMARAVLRDAGDNVMFVDPNPVGSSKELADRHEKTDKRRCVYLMGSDWQKRPSNSSIIVLRTLEDIAAYEESFDIRNWRAVCAQTGHVGLSATQIRAELDSGIVNASFGTAATAVLNDLKKEIAKVAVAEKDTIEGTPAEPKAKPMPKKRRRTEEVTQGQAA